MPRSLTVLSLDGGGSVDGSFRSTVQKESLGHALRRLPDRCPQLAHVRLNMFRRVVDKDVMGRYGTLSIRNICHRKLRTLWSPAVLLEDVTKLHLWTQS